jgi:hypothetical protein
MLIIALLVVCQRAKNKGKKVAKEYKIMGLSPFHFIGEGRRHDPDILKVCPFKNKILN